MPRANIRYEDVIAEKFDDELKRATRREWSWVISLVGGRLLSLAGVIWWLS